MVKSRWLLLLSLSVFTACGDGLGGNGMSESACLIDTTFESNLGVGFNGSVDELHVQDDGKILVGGRFTQFQSDTRNGFVRLESTGLSDNAFNNLANPDDSVFAFDVDSDGSIILGGAFNSVSGQSGARLAKLGSDGRVDQNFSATVSTSPDATVSSLKIDGSHRVVIGGNFTHASALSANHLARYSASGQIDASFLAHLAAGFDLGVDSITVLAGDDYVLAGSFSTFQGQPPGRFTRISTDAIVKQDFVQILGTGFNNAAKAVVERANGGFLVGGAFATLNGQAASYIAAIGADGVPDTAMQAFFPTAINATVQSLVRQSNGKFLVGGEFSRGLYRLNEDGEEDTVFTSDCGQGFDGAVMAVVELNDGSLLVGGDFTQFNGQAVHRLVHLQ